MTIETADVARLLEQLAIHDFYALEARLLDSNRLSDWLGLLHPDISYLTPNRTFKPLADDDFSVVSGALIDDHESIGSKVARYETLHAWSEDPPSMTRRFVTNLEIEAGAEGTPDTARSWTTRTNLLVYHARRDQRPAVLSAARRDVVIDDGAGLRVWRRLVHLDHNTLPVQDLAIFL